MMAKVNALPLAVPSLPLRTRLGDFVREWWLRRKQSKLQSALRSTHSGRSSKSISSRLFQSFSPLFRVG